MNRYGYKRTRRKLLRAAVIALILIVLIGGSGYHGAEPPLPTEQENTQCSPRT